MVSISMITSAHAQDFSFSDLFNQTSKQKNYYLQQIAAYEAFESELKLGYDVIQHGLTSIAEINTAELNAHSAYYSSLRTPGSAVKNSTQVQDILTWQNDIVGSFSWQFNGLTVDEQNYVTGVKANLLKACNVNLAELQSLLQYGTWQMTADERLRGLDKIHSDMQDKYQFAQSFCNSIRLLAMQREQGANDTQTLKSLYETN